MSRRRICVCVNGPSEKTNGVRVRALFHAIEREADVHYLYRDDSRRRASLLRFCRRILTVRPEIVFVEGIGYTGILAGLFARIVCGSRMVLSTGDAAYEFARACMGRVKAQAVGLMEWTALRASTAIVVWGPYHRELLESRGFDNVFWIPGGVDTALFRPMDASSLRARLGIGGRLTVGVVGSINLNRRQGFCYGWEVVEVVKRLEHLPVAGVVVGTGDGVPFLQEKAREYGISDRLVFTGWVDHQALPEYVNALDVCVSTQSNDVVGQVRITAKIPEYLACGRFIVTTAVGGAQEFVKDSGVLLESRGVTDREYVDRLTDVVRGVVEHPERLLTGQRGVAVARQHFDYEPLRAELHRVIAFVSGSAAAGRVTREYS